MNLCVRPLVTVIKSEDTFCAVATCGIPSIGCMPMHTRACVCVRACVRVCVCVFRQEYEAQWTAWKYVPGWIHESMPYYACSLFGDASPLMGECYNSSSANKWRFNGIIVDTRR